MPDAGQTIEIPSFGAEFRDELTALFSWRRDVRRFRRDPLPENTLARLVQIAALAPSVGLSEPWRFVRVENPERRAHIQACFTDCNAEALQAQADDRAGLYARLKLEGLKDAPLHLAVFADRSTTQGHGLGRRTMPQTIEYSAVMAIHTLWLAARAEGIGVGWISILDPARVTAILDVPDHWIFVGYLCIGYPLEETDTPLLERESWERRREPRGTILQR